MKGTFPSIPQSLGCPSSKAATSFPYYQNRNKRLVKTPKLYFYDTGLLCHLLGIRKDDQLETDRLKGSVFENLVVAEFHKKNYHRYEHHDFFFWQDTHGNEVDLLWRDGHTCHAVEIKATKTITNELFKQLDKFEAGSDIAPKIQKIVVYGG